MATDRAYAVGVCIAPGIQPGPPSWDGEQWSEMAESDRPLTPWQTLRTGFRCHPAKTTGKVAVAAMVLYVYGFLFLFGVLIVISAIKG